MSGEHRDRWVLNVLDNAEQDMRRLETWQAGACREIEALQREVRYLRGQCDDEVERERKRNEYFGHANQLRAENKEQQETIARRESTIEEMRETIALRNKALDEYRRENGLLNGKLAIRDRNAKQSDIEFAELRRQLERVSKAHNAMRDNGFINHEPVKPPANDWATFKHFRVRKDAVQSVKQGKNLDTLWTEIVGVNFHHEVMSDEMSYDEVVKVVSGG